MIVERNVWWCSLFAPVNNVTCLKLMFQFTFFKTSDQKLVFDIDAFCY